MRAALVTLTLCQDFRNDAGRFYAGELLVEALIGIAEGAIVESQQIKHGGMQITYFDGIAHNVIAEIVGGPVADAFLDTASGQPDEIYRPRFSCIGVRPNSPPQTINVSSSSPRSFRSLRSAAVGWSVA